MKDMRSNHLFPLILAFLFSHIVVGQVGMLDATFGTGGMASTDLDTNYVRIQTMAVQSDGRIIIAGRWFSGVGHDVFMLRYMPDGSLDPSFGDLGQASADLGSYFDECSSISILPDNKILMAGTVESGPSSMIAIARFNGDGSLDSSFATGGVSIGYQFPYSSAHDMQIQSDGRIVLAGEMNWQMAVFRFLPDGTADSTFHADGMMRFQTFYEVNALFSLAIQDDDKIVVSGFGGPSGDYDIVLARILPNGGFDPTFASNGWTTLAVSPGDDVLGSIAIQSDGKIVVVGSKDHYPDYDIFVARFHTNGGLDNSFGNAGLSFVSNSVFTDRAYDVVLQPDGKILMSGSSEASPGTASAALLRMLPNGQMDLDFGQNGTVIQYSTAPHIEYAIAIDLQTDGKILIAGNMAWQPTVARYLSGLFASVGQVRPHDMGISVFPNPVGKGASLEIAFDRSELVSVQVQDMQGRVVKSFLEQVHYAAGDHRIDLDMEGMADGIYNVAVHTSRMHSVVKVIKL